MRVKISDIKIKPGRRDAKPKGVEELARSIQALGLLNPIIVTEAKKVIRDADGKITKGAALNISRLLPDQQEEAAVRLTTSPPPPKKQNTMDGEALLAEFKSVCCRYVSGIESFHRQADIFAGTYKNKRRYFTLEDQQAVFENTHEPIINTEIWELVQRNRQQRRRPTKSDGIALLSGLLFCSDCGSRLSANRIEYRGMVSKKYVCSKYKNSRGGHPCTIHYIREDDLVKLVLENLRKVIAYAQDYEDEFVQ